MAGVLMGMSNMGATIPGFLVPTIVAAMTHGRNDLGPWHNVFYLTAGLLLLELVLYTLMASGVEQSWNKVSAEANGANQVNEGGGVTAKQAVTSAFN